MTILKHNNTKSDVQTIAKRGGFAEQKPNITEQDTFKSQQHFLSEILMIRLYEADLAKWTIRELKQWMHYMLLGGVEHFYVCDHFKIDEERLDVKLRTCIDAGLVT